LLESILQIDTESTCETSFSMSWSVSDTCKTSFSMSWSVSDIQDKSGTIVFFVEGCTSLFDFSDTTAVDKVAEGVTEVEGDAEVGGVAEVEGDAKIDGDAEVEGDAKIEGDAEVDWDAEAEVATEAEGVAKEEERFNTPWHFFLVSGDLSEPGKNLLRLGYSLE